MESTPPLKTRDDYEAYIRLAAAAFQDGIDRAVVQIAEYQAAMTDPHRSSAQKAQITKGPEHFWIDDDTNWARGFRWYCCLFNLEPERVRALLYEKAQRSEVKQTAKREAAMKTVIRNLEALPHEFTRLDLESRVSYASKLIQQGLKFGLLENLNLYPLTYRKLYESQE